MTLLDEYYDYREGAIASKEKQIVFSIITDMSDRSGLGNEWDSIDDDIKEEIIEKWLNIVNNKLS